ncbi:hypothetical protein GCK32_008417 [Trichostrongylus colubriformis]|uniref:Uncharacterized protein n=1 Tax=Trichostrongylus colubriformis TaxID=6319 RepID=A0AAN8F470_TRICO
MWFQSKKEKKKIEKDSKKGSKRGSKKGSKKGSKRGSKKSDDAPIKPARSPPRSSDPNDLLKSNLQAQPLQTPPALASDPNFLKQSEIKRKKQSKKDGEDSDNTLTDLPAEMPNMELERIQFRQQLIFDDQLL